MLGITLDVIDTLKICVRGDAIKSAAKCKKYGSSLLGPADFEISRSLRALCTSGTSNQSFNFTPFTEG